MQNKPFIIVNRLEQKGEILLYGNIGMFGEITADKFANECYQLSRQYDDIDMHVNCVGGNVYDGIAIRNTVKRTQQITNSYIDGIAASMGSVIALAPGKVHISKYGRLMTHPCSGYVEGGAEDMRNAAEEMDNIDNDLAQMIATKTGLSVEEAKAKYINGKDRFWTAEQAKEAGLVDSIYDAAPVEIPEVAKNDEQLWGCYQAALTAHLKTDNKHTIVIL